MKKLNTLGGDMNRANNGIIAQIKKMYETRVKNAGDDPKKQGSIWSPFMLGSLLTWTTGKNQKRIMASIDCIVESIACYNDMAELNQNKLAWLYVVPSENVKDFESVKCYFTTDRTKFKDDKSGSVKTKPLDLASFLKAFNKLLEKYEKINDVDTVAIKAAVDAVTTAPTSKK